MKKKLTTVSAGGIEKINHLSGMIKKNGGILASKKITAGFDGFVDTIVRIIRDKRTKKPPIFFNKKKEFGEYIIGKEGTSFSLEMEELKLRLGGNMPIMANALGRLGIKVNCLGALGYPQLHPVFKTLSTNCKIRSFADPGLSTAVEFNDGKIFLGQMDMLNKAGWQIIKDRIGLENITRLYRNSDLLCIVNWAEIDASGDIWKGLLKDVFPVFKKHGEKQLAFFDLSDCSKRSAASIREALSLLRQFGQHTRVMLGLNQNEARSIYQVLNKTTTDKDLAFLGKSIYKKLAVDTLILHSSKETIAFDHQGNYTCKSFFIKNPGISTGAGDNFNAGFCAASLMNLDIESSLIFANAVAGLYIRNGISPQLSDIIDFLKNNAGNFQQ